MEISVIIPVYNAAAFVEKAVESALQFDEVKEVLLVEDASPDNALEICQELEKKHERVKLFQHSDKKNHGAGASRNLGIKNANCPFIAFLDADDFYLPNRFNAEKDIFKKKPEVDGVYNALGFYYYSQTLRYKNILAGQEEISTIKEILEPKVLPFRLLGIPKYCGYFTLDALTIKKDLALNCGLFNETLRLHQDTDFIIRVSVKGQIFPGEIRKPVGMRGVHQYNRSLEIKNLHFTRTLLHHALWTWGRDNNIDRSLLNFIKNRYIVHKINSSNWLTGLLLLLKSSVLNKDFFFNPIFFNPALSKIIVNDKLYKFAIKAKEKIQIVCGVKLVYVSQDFKKR